MRPSLPRILSRAIGRLASLLALATTAAAAADARSNVLFIVVDDLRPELGCYGADDVRSPHIDRLARQGMLCRNAYAQYPVCNPSRSSFLSGLRPDETNIVSNDVPFRARLPDLVALPQLFRQHGWFTAGIGKVFHRGQDPAGAPARFADSVAVAAEPADRSPQARHAIPNHHDFATFTDRERREFKRAYHACVSYADAQVGRLLAALDRLTLWDSTIVILIGDHGYHLGEHDWWHKVTVYELGVRTPLIAWVPGAAGMGRSTAALIELVDLYPTLADYAGLEPPHRLAGTSLRPVFADPAHPGKSAAYS